MACECLLIFLSLPSMPSSEFWDWRCILLHLALCRFWGSSLHHKYFILWTFFANLKLTHLDSFLEWAQQGLFASKESITDSSSGVAGGSKLFQSFSWVIEWLFLVEDLCWSTELLEVNESNCYVMSKESTPTSPSSCFYTLHRTSFMVFSWGWLM